MRTLKLIIIREYLNRRERVSEKKEVSLIHLFIHSSSIPTRKRRQGQAAKYRKKETLKPSS
jgi:hypothetical protein